MQKVQIRVKTFVINIPEQAIQNRIAEIAKQIDKEYNGLDPVFLCVLNGAFLFAADLFKNISTNCEIAFIRVSSYSGTSSTGHIKNLVGVTENIKDRNVVILEDIVDTGDTAIYLVEELKKHNPSSVKFASLLLKPKALRHEFRPDYIGFEVPNDFLVGYGLDYDGYGRNLKDIYKLSE
ncbi:MAG: hypoxanthine phosphoribosyltransferase [Bacteroidetes bacterium]|nr:MAG: hypoxanthine phosphoribosyltransferase [Bacteroidota bacterium]REK08020.1 MAG: hypoxanthine phosphoribosyltransferase [Bacteroidota bacterium]REK32225.1 MAG: hypoxanthine phosphoribosyltransferase [Bacteroidota bacterium]REK47377.1 MAG: hypoxanthine phosphoribosyltransferase [Bacteroidota bacterium]